MRLVVTQNITLDGVIEALDGWFEPSGDNAGSGTPDTSDTSDIVDELRGHMAGQDGLLLGRDTFEQFRGYWPNQTDDTTGITDHLNRVAKYVVSSILDDPGWANTTVLRGDLDAELAALKARPGGELGVTGSITLVHHLVAHGLVDEYRLFVYPVVLGRGRRLFEPAAGGGRTELALVDARPFRSGIVLLSYRPA